MERHFRRLVIWACKNHAKSLFFQPIEEGVLVAATVERGGFKRYEFQILHHFGFEALAALVKRESTGLAAVCWSATIEEDFIKCLPTDPAVSGNHEEWQKLVANG